MNTKVNWYYRASPKGNMHKVSTHERGVKKRGGYKIAMERQLSPTSLNSDYHDAKYTAQLPGKRESQNKEIYYERRRNRSDEDGSDL